MKEFKNSVRVVDGNVEKALRKLDSMQANMARVQDLTVELRRQLRPLGKQAEVAK